MTVDRFAPLEQLPRKQAWAELGRLLAAEPARDDEERSRVSRLLRGWPARLRRARLDAGRPAKVERPPEWPFWMDEHVSRELGLVRTLIASPATVLGQPIGSRWATFCFPSIRRWEPSELSSGEAMQRACDRFPLLTQIDLREMITGSGVWGGADPSGAMTAIAQHQGGLRVLGLATAPLSADHLASLARSPTATTLRKLDMTACHAGGAALAALDAWPPDGRLRILRAGWNAIAPDVLARWSRSPLFRSIEVLAMPGNTVFPEGARHVAASGVLGHLRRLDLSECSLCNEGVEQLCRALSPRAELRDLGLAGDLLDDGAVELLCDSGLLMSLERLDLRGNELTVRSLDRIEAAWPGTTDLLVLVDTHAATSDRLARRPFSRSGAIKT